MTILHVSPLPASLTIPVVFMVSACTSWLGIGTNFFFSSEKDHPSYINSNKTLQVIQQRCRNPGGGWRVHEIQNGKFVPVATGQIRTRRSEPDKLHTPSLSLSESLENRCQTDRSHKPKPGFGIRPSKMKEREGNLHTPSLIHGGRRVERKAGEEGG